jgi:tRNA pseudouridine55 synthase
MIEDGIINLNKPKGISSHGCVQKIRKLTGIKRVGHMGTLDPMAEGVLPVCIGNAVRISEYLDLDFKKYRADMILGVTTDTQDVWGRVLLERCASEISCDLANKAAESFLGLIEQTPPKYSALKVDGKRLYEYARAGEDVEIKKRNVFIKDISIDLSHIADLRISLEITCSKGTYIRTICHDMGEMLGCGAAMSGLVRLASGVFTIEDAVPLDELKSFSRSDIENVLKETDYPLVHFGRATVVSREKAEWLTNGGRLKKSDVSVETEPEQRRMYNMYFVNETGEKAFLGVAFYDESSEEYKADKIFYRRSSL